MGCPSGAVQFCRLASVEGCKQSGAPDEGQVAAGTNQAAPGAANDFSNAWQKTKEAGSNAWSGVSSFVQSAADYTNDHKDVFLAKGEDRPRPHRGRGDH